MFQPLVTCVVTVYNLSDCIQRCVDSLLAQDYGNVRILIVDDGSTDDSLAICQSLAKDNKVVSVLSKENGGQSSARNYAVERLSSGYVVFIDGDDVVTPDFVSTLVGALPDSAQSGEICITSVGLHQTGDPMRWLDGYAGSNAAILHLSSEQALRKLLTQGGLNESPCGKLAPVSLWAQIPFPEGRIYEDLAIMAKLIGKADRVSIVDSALYGQVFREGSTTRRKITRKQFENFESAVCDVIEYIMAHNASLQDELFYFEALMCVRLIRLSRDVVKGDSHIEESCEAAKRYLLDQEKRIYSCCGISLSLKVKVFLILHLPSLYQFLYDMNEKKKRNA